jgi:hypothetical protein
MKHLQSLNLTTQSNDHADPVTIRRAKLIQRLELQRQLAENAGFTATATRLVRDASGNRTAISVNRRIQPWWRETARGSVELTIKYGAKPLELAKGKTAITIADRTQLVPTLNTIIAAVRAGELDEQLSQRAKSMVAPKRKQKT